MPQPTAGHGRLGLWVINIVIFLLLLVVAEFALRLLGLPYTRKPDPLVLEDSFTLNAHGLFTANPVSETFRRQGITINHDGFRSPEFPVQRTDERSRTSVMIISTPSPPINTRLGRDVC